MPIVPFLLLALAACQRAAAPLPQEIYVWQRQWDGEVRDALNAARDSFAAWRVLAAEADRSGRIHDAAPDLPALARSGRPVTAVLRLDGSVPPPDADVLEARIAALLRAWRGAGVQLAGVEIDHDCAAARLAVYAALLRRLRAALPADVRLSVTALPSWNGAAALEDVLAAADESVLQVHAVSAPARGLFDAGAAQRWIEAYARRAPRPFRVALPAYGVRASFDAGGQARAVRAEMPRDDGADVAADDVRELSAAPQEVASLLRALQRSPPHGLAGVVWFRLPRADDRRAWSLATLDAVIAGAPLTPSFAVRLADDGGARDVVLANDASVDAAVPRAIVLAASDCAAADGVNGYRLENRRDGWRLVADGANTPLRAGRERRIGWVQCATVDKVSIE